MKAQQVFQTLQEAGFRMKTIWIAVLCLAGVGCVLLSFAPFHPRADLAVRERGVVPVSTGQCVIERLSRD